MVNNYKMKATIALHCNTKFLERNKKVIAFYFHENCTLLITAKKCLTLSRMLLCSYNT